MEERGSFYTHLMAVWGWRACNRHPTASMHRLAKFGRERRQRPAGRPGGGPIGRHLARLATDFRLNAPDRLLVAVLHDLGSVLARGVESQVGLVKPQSLSGPLIKPTPSSTRTIVP